MAVKDSRCRFMFQIDKDKKRVIEELAKNEGRSISNMINRMLDIYLKEHNIKVDEE